MQHQITEQLIKQAAVNNGTSAITEAALSQANARQNKPIPQGATSQSSTAYTGGVLSSFSGAASSVGNVIGRLFFGGNGAASSSGMVEQPIPEDARSAYHSLPGDYQTADDLASFYSLRTKQDDDVLSQKAESVRSLASQHLHDLGNQQTVVLPISSSSSSISDTLPAPPTQYYQPATSPPISVNSSDTPPPLESVTDSPPISVHSSPPISVHSSSSMYGPIRHERRNRAISISSG